MPKLPHVSGADVVRALERLGFAKVRQSGSHVIMRRESKGCVVPMHREVKVGTLAGVLRQAEVSAEEFVAALRA
ncbi:MAG: type II toxin-antitoxin system HicA family toxin [Burkholderiaceae bacterium]|nr:type II toxin-antitoxin system HicA family toxin [Burkholderiaceae bacterium]